MNTNKQLTKGNKMKKAIVIRQEEEKTTIVQILCGLMIGFAVIDFAASFAGYNLTPFLGSASRFSPIVFGLIATTFLVLFLVPALILVQNDIKNIFNKIGFRISS